MKWYEDANALSLAVFFLSVGGCWFLLLAGIALITWAAK